MGQVDAINQVNFQNNRVIGERGDKNILLTRHAI
jgi:hypothetical protein